MTLIISSNQTTKYYELPKLKSFAEDKLRVAKITELVFKIVTKTKEKILLIRVFYLLFLRRFHKSSSSEIIKTQAYSVKDFSLYCVKFILLLLYNSRRN